MCPDQDMSVQAAAAINWGTSYRRCFGEVEMEEWGELMAKLETACLTYAGVIDVQMEIWKAKIPLKVQNFFMDGMA